MKSSLIEHFSVLPDPRKLRNRRHDLHDIIVIAILAVICGADSWVEVECFGVRHEKFLRKYLH